MLPSLEVVTHNGFSPFPSRPLHTSQTLLGKGIRSVYIVPNGQAIAHVPQPVHNIFARLRIPASLVLLGIFSRASCGHALMHGALSHLRHIKAKRIISSSESNPLFSG